MRSNPMNQTTLKEAAPPSARPVPPAPQTSPGERLALPRVGSELAPIARKLESGKRLDRADGLLLFQTSDLLGLGQLADWSARSRHGTRVWYVSNGHINYSNFCTLSCAFCSF